LEICTVRKLDHTGKLVTSYQGEVIHRDERAIVLEARWQRNRLELPYVVFERGDRLVEFFFSDRWYNIFEIHAGSADRLKGWYCNLCRPAVFEADAISAIDMALDLFVFPNGDTLLLDENEFEALNLHCREPETHASVLSALAELHRMVVAHQPPFDA
jgi:protein associated with RNAse G/E